jgi:Ran GTPase-activating protein (RanGAP) involved in mRNA processing and transport
MLALERVLSDLAQGRCTGTVDLRPSKVQGRRTLGAKTIDDDLRDENLAPLVEALASGRLTGELNLAGNKITEQGLLHLTKVLVPANGTGVSSLILSGNPIASRGGEALAAVIRRSTSLKKIDISGTHISDDGIGFICQAMIETDTSKR